MSRRQWEPRWELERVLIRDRRAWERWQVTVPDAQEQMLVWVQSPRSRSLRASRRRRLREALDVGFNASVSGAYIGPGYVG